MSFTLRKVAGTAVLAVAASALTLPYAAPASAVAPTERVWTLADTDADVNGSYGLSADDLPGGTPTVVDETTSASFSDLSASSDGSRLVYVRDTETRNQVVVRDIGGQVVRTVADISATGSSVVFEPVLSPNGSTVAWTQFTLSSTGGVFSVRRAAVASGAASTALSGYVLLAFLDDSTILVQNTNTGAIKSLPVAGGTPAATTGIPAEAEEVTVSPQGTRIAWAEDTSSSAGNSTAEIHVATLDHSSGPWTATGEAVLSSTLDNEQPAFSRDGNTVYWVQYNGGSGPGEVLSRPFDASSAATTVATTTADEIDVAVTTVPSTDSTPPGSANLVPFTLNGTSPTIRWTLPTGDPSLSGVIVSRPGKSVFVPAPLIAYVDAGLTLGSAYTYSITAVDRSGNAASAVSRDLRAVLPGAYFSSPTSAHSTTTSFPVRFAVGGNSATHYFVDYLPSGGTWHSWVSDDTGVATRTFGAPATTHVAATTSIAGGTYTFRVKVVDEFGNSSARVGSAKAVVPFDQKKATFVGGRTVSSSKAYLGSFRRLSTTAQYAKVTLVGDKLQVVGWKCPSCGAFAIYDGATRIGTVSTHASTLTPRVLLFSKTYAARGTHTFTIRPLGTAGHPGVALDGFAMRR